MVHSGETRSGCWNCQDIWFTKLITGEKYTCYSKDLDHVHDAWLCRVGKLSPFVCFVKIVVNDSESAIASSSRGNSKIKLTRNNRYQCVYREGTTARKCPKYSIVKAEM